MNTTVNRSILLCQAANVPSLCCCHPCLIGGCTLTTTTKLKQEKPTSNSRKCANTPVLFPSCCSSYHGLFICYLPSAGADEKEHATTLKSWHGVSIDRFIFRTNFLGMSECHDRSQKTNLTSLDRNSISFTKNSRFSCDVTAVMLVYRTIAKKVFWEFDAIIMQNLSDILPLFCTWPTWPSHHVSENQESIIL